MEIKEAINKLTLLEKIQLCNGLNLWQSKAYEEYDIPSFFMCDGPSGLRRQDVGENAEMTGMSKSHPATCYPTSVTTANTWNKELLYKLGEAIGQEAQDQKVNVVLGPGVNIKRNPLCGRNFEYFSEDPILAGNLAAQLIKGIQSQDVGACLKHFACNSQEKSRFTSNGLIDERTLREIYLKAFEIAIKEARPATIMSSYPLVNGVHCSNNKKLLNDILRDEWGFDGVVMTDWGGMDNRVEAFEATNDLMMPGGSDYMEKDIIEAVKNGSLKEEYIDKCCERIIRLARHYVSKMKKDYIADYDAHHKLAVKIASEGAVLLKNENNLLPLDKNKKLLIIGDMAKNVRYQGAGSSHVSSKHLEQPIEYLNDYQYAQGCDHEGDTNDDLLNDLKEKAKDADAVVIFAGLPRKYESEGYDRQNMKMPEGHNKMIEAAVEANKNVVVVLMCGSPVECPWADKVNSILYMGLAGEGVGKATYDLLFGEVNPSGKLSESWPYKYEDVISSDYYVKQDDAIYLEGIYVGYRYYDKANVNVRWPFGYGLSYTTFKLSDLKVNDRKVSLTITNTGNVKGSETVQLYVGQINPALNRAIRELKHFTKVSLEPNESKEINFELSDDDFKVWDGSYKVIQGEYNIEVGTSSRNILLTEKIYVEGDIVEKPSWQENSFYEKCEGKPSLAQWEKMSSMKYEPRKLIKGQFTLENSVEEMKEHSFVMKIMYKIVEKTIAKVAGGKVDYNNPEFRMMMNSAAGGPVRSMCINGGRKSAMFVGFVDMANGHYLKGLGKIIRG